MSVTNDRHAFGKAIAVGTASAGVMALVAMVGACSPKGESSDAGCDLQNVCGATCCAAGEACVDTGCCPKASQCLAPSGMQCCTGGEQCNFDMQGTLGCHCAPTQQCGLTCCLAGQHCDAGLCGP